MESSKLALPGLEESVAPVVKDKNKSKTTRKSVNSDQPPNLGKVTKLPIPDFNDPNRPRTCLEVDFPIAQINALSNLEGNAGKPIYQMSKWWARRRSSVFRSLLIAAALQAPEKDDEAAKLVWEHYYANHQKAGNFKSLKVLDPFMGGGTTLVEGARLGFHVFGVDLNPVAWFVVKNELAGTDPAAVQRFFEQIEAEVKPQLQPFYTTTGPNDEKGKWIDTRLNQVVDIDPINLKTEERVHYRYEGPEIIYTFWVKHGQCQAPGCGHRTPIFTTPVVAIKELSTFYIELTCSACNHTFRAELGETRMAPDAELVILESEPSFTEMSQSFAQLLKDYSQGTSDEKRKRVQKLSELVEHEPGLCCPMCNAFAGNKVKAVIDRHRKAQRISDLRKTDFEIERYKVAMTLLIHSDWLKGSPGFDKQGNELGGYAGAGAESTAEWYRQRLEKLQLIEVRGRVTITKLQADGTIKEETGLPDEITLSDGSTIRTGRGTVPERSTFICSACGRQEDILDATRPTGHTPPTAVYLLQCYSKNRDLDGYNYNGRYFKAPDANDYNSLVNSDKEWETRSQSDLSAYWPREELFVSYMTHRLNGGIPNWGYTHWWKMFNSRQLLVHTQFLRSIMNISNGSWDMVVREQALGALQQYLRNQNMFCFWDQGRDHLVPMMSNANYHPKSLVVENGIFSKSGRGNWETCVGKIVEGLSWATNPWEPYLDGTSSQSTKHFLGDSILNVHSAIFCRSSTDLAILDQEKLDLVITDPPFGNLLYYADLADFFHVWMRIPFSRWYANRPDANFFSAQRTPHAIEAITNPVEHPDDRTEWEKTRLVSRQFLKEIRELTDDESLFENDPNPLYRPEPASDFYKQTLTACWAEAGRILKPSGIMAFTFHHSEDEPWLDVLEALFDAGFILTATYPIRSDETKGDSGAFGSRKIEYDIVHVCRKRLTEPEPVSWSRMRRWVRSEALRLRELLETSHGKELPIPDLLVILRGKALEFYSRHYGSVYTGDDQVMGVRDALLGINQLLEDLVEGDSASQRLRPPDEAEPATRLLLRLFHGVDAMERDELHKSLRGTGVAQDDLEALGWIYEQSKVVYAKPIPERFAYLTAPGRTRKILRTDLDQAHFLIGAALPKSGIDIVQELNRAAFTPKQSVVAILAWYAQTALSEQIRNAAKLALDLLNHWRTQPQTTQRSGQMSLFAQLEGAKE